MGLRGGRRNTSPCGCMEKGQRGGEPVPRLRKAGLIIIYTNKRKKSETATGKFEKKKKPGYGCLRKGLGGGVEKKVVKKRVNTGKGEKGKKLRVKGHGVPPYAYLQKFQRYFEKKGLFLKRGKRQLVIKGDDQSQKREKGQSEGRDYISQKRKRHGRQ